MCEPFKATESKLSLYYVRSEIHSACSSLNMPPEPLDEIKPDAFYMTDKFQFARHAYDHLKAALENAILADRSIRAIYFKMRQLGMNREDISADKLADSILDLAEKLYEIL